jgi:putative transcriptional regulator
MTKQYRSALMASIHETVEGLHGADVMDKRTMREFDEMCLTPVRALKANKIRALRLREGATSHGREGDRASFRARRPDQLY